MSMKKVIAAVLAAASLLSLAGCGNNETSGLSGMPESTTDGTSSVESTSTAGSASSTEESKPESTSSAAESTANSSSAANSTSSVVESNPESTSSVEESKPESTSSATQSSSSKPQSSSSKPQSSSSKPVTQPVPEVLDWSKVPVASDDDFEYTIGGDLQYSYAYVTKYIGTAAYVKMPSELGGEKVIQLHNNVEWGDTVKAIMLSPGCCYTSQYKDWEYGVWRPTNGIGIAPNVTEVVIPDNWTSVGLYGMTNLEKVNFPKGLTEIKDNAFSGSKLSSVTIPDSVETIGAAAFANCTNLSVVNFPKSFASGKCTMKTKVFEGCTKIKSIVLPGDLYCDYNSVQSIFNNCTSLEKVTLSSGFKNVVPKMFDGCTALKEVNLPDGLQKIGAYAFRNCTSLKSLAIPDSVTRIAQGIFNGCTGFTITYMGQTFNEKNYIKIVNATDES